MREVVVYYSGVWSTVIELPNGVEFNMANVEKLIEPLKASFNFQDGTAMWDLDSAELQ